jgi:hypothetical protein
LSLAVALGMENNFKNFLRELRKGMTGSNLRTEPRLEMDVPQTSTEYQIEHNFKYKKLYCIQL